MRQCWAGLAGRVGSDRVLGRVEVGRRSGGGRVGPAWGQRTALLMRRADLSHEGQPDLTER